MNGLKDLPQGWAKTTLGDTGEWYGGGTPSKAESKFWTDGTIPWISPKDMKRFRLSDSEDHIAPSALEETNVRRFPKGTVLMVIRSGILSRTFPVAIADEPATMNQDMKGVKPSRDIEPSFLAYQLIAKEHELLRQCSKNGTTVASIDTLSLRSFPIWVAPVPEQRRIVAKIEELFSDLDAGVAALQRVRANLKRYRAAVLNAAFTGKLTGAWHTGNQPSESAAKMLTRILEKRQEKWEEEQIGKCAGAGRTPPKGWREKYSPGVAPDLTIAPPAPKSWVVASVEQLTSIITSGSRDWSQYYGRGTGTFIMAQNVRPAKLDLSHRVAVDPPAGDRDRIRSQVAKDDLLITIVGANTGDPCRVPKEFPEHYVCQRCPCCDP